MYCVLLATVLTAVATMSSPQFSHVILPVGSGSCTWFELSLTELRNVEHVEIHNYYSELYFTYITTKQLYNTAAVSLDEAKEPALQARCCTELECHATPTIAKVQSSKARACARSFRSAIILSKLAISMSVLTQAYQGCF